MTVSGQRDSPSDSPPEFTAREPARVAVVRLQGQFQVVATEDIHDGGRILHVDGPEVDQPSRYSIQVGANLHIDLPLPRCLEDEMDRHPWRFLDHSCEPNASLRGRTLVAIGPIRAWEEVTFDYNTTEYDMAFPFPCRCGAGSCVGAIAGFRHLPPARQQQLEPFLAQHLRRHLPVGGARRP